MADQNIKVKVDLDVSEFSKNAKAMSAALSNILGKDVEVFNGKINKTKQLVEQTEKAMGGAAASITKAGNSVKQSNQQWTNLALVIQDLPYGFRGIQNNLPALMGGIAGLAGPLYLVGSAVIALFTAWDAGLFKVKKSTDALKEANKEYSESLKQSMGNAGQEISNINSLVSIAKNHEESMNKRLQAVKKLQEEYPAYFGNLSKEQILNGNVKKSVDQVKSAILERAKATAVASKINKLSAEKFAKEEELYQLALQKTFKIQKAIAYVNQMKALGYNESAKHLKGLIDTQIQGIREEENVIKGAVDLIDKELERLQGIYEKTSAKSIALDIEPPKDLSNKAAKEAAKLAAFMAKRIAQAGGDIEVIKEPELDPKAQAKAFADKMAFDKKMSRERVALLKEQYQIEVSEAQGSFEQIKTAEENMRNALNQGFMDGTIKLDEYLTAIQELRKKSNKTVSDEAKASMEEMVKMGIGIMNALGPALDMLLEKGANIGEVLSKAFEDVIKKLIKVAIAAAIAVALLSIIFPNTVAKAGGALKMFGNLTAGGMGLGTQLFANGGIVSGPTLGLMGEYPGAANNPEVVAPLDKLQSLIGGGGHLEARISGNDLLILMNKAGRNNNNTF